MSNLPTEETVLSVEHYTDRLFRFTISRPTSFRFRSGEFVMIGLPKIEAQKKPIMRAYSVASPSWADELEFYSIKVADGPLTSRLQKIKKGDTIMIVEAMKTMNHVPSTSDGVVKEICVEDGHPVEFGQTIIILE